MQSSENHLKNNNEPIDKVFISYKLIILSISIIIVSTLLVGLLPSLVNLPECKEKENQLLYKKSFLKNSNLFVLKQLLNNSNTKFLKELDRCDELNEPTGSYLWESYRLPDSIEPIKYDIVLYTPLFAAEEYSGEITIQIKVKKPTDTILLNAKYLSVYIPSLRDSNGNEIELKCDGLFLPNDFYVLKTANLLSAENGKNLYYLDLYFTGFLNVFSSGIFEIKYNYDDQEFDGSMLASHFEPVDARKGYPCFDEPQLKAAYSFKIYHPKGTKALTNMPSNFEEEIDGEILTKFVETPKLPSYLIGLIIFNQTDFSYVEAYSEHKTPIRLWARKNHIENQLTNDPLNMIVKIFNSLEFYFKSDIGDAIPPKIDVFALPFYPQDAVPHSGLIFFKETKLLFKDVTIMESKKQAIALEIAKQLSELWFGNYVTFSWWNELWLQESISDYLKYKIIDHAYPDWQVYDQFITEELIKVLVEDSYPSSHPVIKDVNSPFEIDELFDDVETSKGAAILRMMEYEIGSYDFMLGLKNYLRESKDGIGYADNLWNALDDIRKWSAKDFAQNWLTQSNYPLVRVRIEKNSNDGKYYLNVIQERFRSDYSIFSGDDLYPSAYNFTWYLPLKCTFGRHPKDPEPLDQNFDIDTREFFQVIGDGQTDFKWIHCDQRFSGYYLIDYNIENWENLASVLKAKNDYLAPVDRSQIIHNLFMNCFAGKTSYEQLTDLLSYLIVETDYLPWKTVHKHLSDLADVLEYRRSFYHLSTYFLSMMQEVENKDNFWQASGNHVEELRREILLELSCRMQDIVCLKNATNLWPIVYQSVLDQTVSNDIPPHVKSVVYNYHLQNTYVTNEWRVIFAELDYLPDIQEREILLEAITYSRLPWLLTKFLESLSKDQFKMNDFFDAIRLLSRNELGREICWDFIRSKYSDINSLYGFENQMIGQMLIDVVSSFSEEFLYFELLTFIYDTQDDANENARLRALEIVSTNVNWISDKEEEMIAAFMGIKLNKNLYENKLKKVTIKQRLLNAYKSKFSIQN